MFGSHYSKSEEETQQLALGFAKILHPGDIVGFIGLLGSGKTLFIRAICNYFDVKEIVTSPTFTIMNQYIGIMDSQEVNIIHIDLYRIKSEAELNELGFFELLDTPNSIFLIEWAEKVVNHLPMPYYLVEFENVEQNEKHRIINIRKCEKR